MPILNAHAANNCTGATYYDADSDTCIACPTGYDYNTDAGKTSASQCQIQCAAGTYNPGYTQLEYIESTGTQYIDTGITPNQDSRFRISVMATSTATYARTVGGAYGGTGWADKTFGCYGGASSGIIYFSYASDTNAGDTMQANTKYVFELDKNRFYINNNLVGTASTATFTSVETFKIGMLNEAWKDRKRYLVGRIYDFNMWDNDTMVLDLVPARRNSNGVLGMYDKVNNVFYTNAGTGTFVAGPDVDVWCEDAGTGYWSAGGIVNFGGTPISRTACLAGTYNPTTNATSAAACLDCPVATYNGGTAAASCTACPLGYDHDNGTGNTAITDCQISCPAGTYVDSAATQIAYNLPSEYTQLEYIRTNHNAFIETDLTVNDFDRVTSRVTMYGGNVKYDELFGASASQSYGNVNSKVFRLQTKNGYVTAAYNDKWEGDDWVNYIPTKIPLNTPTDIDVKLANGEQYVKINGQIVGSDTLNAALLNPYHVAIFNINYGGRYLPSSEHVPYLDCEGMVFYMGNTVVANFVPARRNSDNVVGMYDIVGNKFYTNIGTGSFGGGSVINKAQCTDVGAGYWSAASVTNYGSVGTRTACPAGTYNPTTNGTSAAACLSCSGATYNDETAQATCKSCPTGYDYNTTSGKTDATQCQIHCDAGTYFSGYTQLEYIFFDGNSYFDTGFTPNQNTEIRASIKPMQYNCWIYGSGATKPRITAYIGKSGSSGYQNFGDSSGVIVNSGTYYTINQNHNIVQNKTSITIDGTIFAYSNVADFTSTQTMWVGRSGTGTSTPPFIGNFMKFEMYDNGALIRDLVPARRNSDGVLGMYDTVTGQFYTNAGTETFTAGPDTNTLFGAQCVDVGVGYYAPASTVNYGSIGTRTACPAGTYTVGYGHGADEANDCGRILHLGDSVIYTRRNKPTTPALNIRMENGDMYYIGLSTTDHTVSRLHFQTGETKYTAFDDSLYYGERDYDTGEKIVQ